MMKTILDVTFWDVQLFVTFWDVQLFTALGRALVEPSDARQSVFNKQSATTGIDPVRESVPAVH